MTSWFRWAYVRLLKPVLFRIDPEFIHRLFVGIGSLLGSNSVTRWKTAVCFKFRHPSLEQTVAGLHLPNPIGVAAGFDKDGRMTGILPSVGFGFMEIGSVTARPCAGNAGKHLWRLPASRGRATMAGRGRC